MKPCIMKILVVVSAISVFTGVSFTGNNAWSSSSPYVSVLPSVFDGIGLPVRIAPDVDANGNPTGFIYVTDPRGGGILKYDAAGKLQQTINTVTYGMGIAVTKSGKLLVAQGASVAVLDKATGNFATPPTFGTFSESHGIAIDAAGNIYVTDTVANNIQVFDSNFALTATLGTKGTGPNQFIRPTGITYEKVSGYLAVCDTLNGRINFINTAGVTQYSIPADSAGKALGIGSGQNRFTSLKGVSFQYTPGGVLDRIYAVDTFQSNIQVFDGTSRAFLVSYGVGTNDSNSHPLNGIYIGSYGYLPGNLITPTDVLFDATNALNPHLVVANGSGSLAMYGIDSLEPSDVTIQHPSVFQQLSLSWTNPPATSGFNHIKIYRSTTKGQLGSVLVDGLTGTSYTDIGLLDNTTYYYTVRALNGQSVESTGTNQVSETTMGNFLLTTNVAALTRPAGSGSGSVTGTDSNGQQVVSCASGTCTTLIHTNDTVTLTPSPNGYSIFKGWSGDCQNLTGNCQVTLDQARNVTATFEAQYLFKIEGGQYRDLLQDAYNITPDGSKVMAQAGVVPAETLALSAGNANTVYLIGGYDSNFVNNSLDTVIQGKVSVSSGKLIVNKIKIK